MPDLRALGRAARDARALLVVDNTVAGVFGCDPLRLGAVLSLEALDRVCAGKSPRKLVAASVARSQLKRHRVDAAAECAYALLERCDALALDLSVEEVDVLERGLSSLDTRMQAHFDRARALAEYLAANEMVRDVRYPGLTSHPDHAVATGILEHGFGPAVEFDLIELSAGELFDALPGSFAHRLPAAQRRVFRPHAAIRGAPSASSPAPTTLGSCGHPRQRPSQPAKSSSTS